MLYIFINFSINYSSYPEFHNNYVILRIIQEENAYYLRSLSAWRAWIEIMFAIITPGAHASLSAWRAWIEITITRCKISNSTSLSAWRAWIEISILLCMLCQLGSLSAWRAWIEMLQKLEMFRNQKSRSPLGERGLKFSISLMILKSWHVALRLESVD